jgi:hypothetical protein
MTATCSHWFWPMGGGVDRTGQLDIFYVEMANELGSGAAPSAHIRFGVARPVRHRHARSHLVRPGAGIRR